VSEDASLKTLAASRIARGANRIHSIRSTLRRSASWIICATSADLSCGCSAPQRLIRVGVAEAVDGWQVVNRLLTARHGPVKKLKFPPESISGLRDQLFDGLVMQLRSIPIDLRVDS
jgi:hypothetical protein